MSGFVEKINEIPSELVGVEFQKVSISSGKVKNIENSFSQFNLEYKFIAGKRSLEGLGS
jgi:hypothetical protein